MELSLDGKCLAIACGTPTLKVIFINVEERKILGGSQNFISLKGREKDLVKIGFNPTNRKVISVAFKKRLEIYDMKDCL